MKTKSTGINKTTTNAQPADNRYWLKAGDIFTVDDVRVRRDAILDVDFTVVYCDFTKPAPAPIVYTRSPNIVRILHQPWSNGQTFRVGLLGLYKNRPILTLECLAKGIFGKLINAHIDNLVMRK